MIFALLLSGCPQAPPPDAPVEVVDQATYTCPMHPSVRQQGPGKCPLCGMDLVKLQDDAVRVDEAQRLALGITVEPAAKAPMRSTLALPAIVGWDQSRLSDVSVKVQGWVRDLVVVGPGARVKAGDTLFTLYSPDLVATQEDLAAATRQAQEGVQGAEARAEAARKRLLRWDIPAARIDRAAAGEPAEALPIPAPRGGLVLESSVVEGAMVSPGQTLFRIGDLREVWLEVSVPEARLPHVRVGSEVEVEVAGEPARKGRVERIEPGLDPATRSARLRVDVDNADEALRPDQWATVKLPIDAGERLSVPESAVLYTGPRRLVFVDGGDERLSPREVTTGLSAGGRIEILDGLAEGEKVVTAGNFLVAADSRLRQAP